MNTISIKTLALGVLFASNVVVAADVETNLVWENRDTQYDVTEALGCSTDLMGAMYKTRFEKAKNAIKAGFDSSKAVLNNSKAGFGKALNTTKQEATTAKNSITAFGYKATAKGYSKNAANFVSAQASNVAKYAKENKTKSAAIVAASAAAAAAVYVAYQKGVFGKIKAKAVEYKKSAVAAVATAAAAGTFGLGLYLNSAIAA